jgi:hypothetical protein
MPFGYASDSKHWRGRADEMRSLSLLKHHFDTGIDSACSRRGLRQAGRPRQRNGHALPALQQR